MLFETKSKNTSSIALKLAMPLLLIMILATALPVLGAQTWTYTTESSCFDIIVYSSYSSEVVCTQTSTAPAPSEHHLLTAILMSEDNQVPEVDATDTQGDELVVNGVPVVFEESQEVAERLEQAHPSPEGLTWFAFQSTELIPAADQSTTMTFFVNYQVYDDAAKDSEKVIWVSNDSDLRNGDMVFGAGDVPRVIPNAYLVKAIESELFPHLQRQAN